MLHLPLLLKYNVTTFLCCSNVLRFYADETSPPEQLHSVADVKAALVSGKQIHYSAMLFLCSGDAPWEAAGGHIKGKIH